MSDALIEQAALKVLEDYMYEQTVKFILGDPLAELRLDLIRRIKNDMELAMKEIYMAQWKQREGNDG